MSENSHEEISDQLETIVGHIEQLSTRLLDVLQSERRALVERSLSELETLTADKAALCAALEAAVADLGPIPLRQQIAGLPDPRRGLLEPAHSRLLDLALKTQECNAVNGKIVRRSQQSTRELMHLMSGTDTGTLYSAQGYQAQHQCSGQPLSGSLGTAIARA